MRRGQSGGKSDSWAQSRAQVISLGRSNWILCRTAPDVRGYDVTSARGELPPPVWPPDAELPQLLDLAFSGLRITHIDHPAAIAALSRKA